MKIFSTDPYYDDFSIDNKYYRILFKPGFPVQARELTQLQTILQNQINQFGDHVFKNGSVVIPGNTLIDKNLNYVKLQTTNGVGTEITNFIDELEGREFVGATSGVKAKVIKISDAENSDPPTIFVKYLNSGTNFTTSVFADGETLNTSDTGTSYSVRVAVSSATGKTVSATINRGIYYINGVFALVTAQTIILDKYSTTPSYKIGLEITESAVTSDTDSALLDPAIGTFNYFAPGANRYKLDLTFVKRSLSTVTSSDTFIELIRIESGEIVTRIDNPQYNILRDELARRTFDESGDYTVNPFDIKIIEHLKTGTEDGFLTSGDGGTANKGVAVISPGKAYVKGYEIDIVGKTYLPFDKARDTSNVTNTIVRTPIGNYVNVTNTFSIPNFTSDLNNVELYNRYTTVRGVASGTIVGNAKIRGYEVDSGNVQSSSGSFKTFIFDVEMLPGFTFERDVKQLRHAAVSDTGYVSNTFTGDTVVTNVPIPGTGTLEQSSTTITGVNTNFTSNLKVGDFINFTTDTPNNYRVTAVTSTTAITITPAYPLANVSGVTINRNETTIQDVGDSILVFPFPDSTIKTFSDVTYRTRRVFYGTLAAGSITITAAANETLASVSDSNYFAVAVTGTSGGSRFRITDAITTEIDARNFTFNLSTYGLTNQDVLIYATVIKSNPTVKTKTLTTANVTLTAEADCKAFEISLNEADIYELVSVNMSANAFGTAYSASNEVAITDRYTLNDGQNAFFYDIGTVKRKSGTADPTGPIRITYKYFDHGSGDYFSVRSYSDYSTIGEFNDNGTIYKLRDCLDFRPRISDSGVNFKDSGSSRNEFLDFNNDFQCDYEFYLPRTDKIYLTTTGNLAITEGISSNEPQEPNIPENSVALYVLEQPAYVFDVENDITIRKTDQKRYTMKDIGKLENRIKNLEYYTTLSLLEKDTALFSIKDEFGLDRYKNGFVVESFTGHGIGDVYNIDYNNAMDFASGELRPAGVIKTVKFDEFNTTSGQRTANGYTLNLAANSITLAYTDALYLESNAASTTESINPFDVFTFNGTITLQPYGDWWISTTDRPLILENPNGSLDTLIPDAAGQAVYGSVWNSWKEFWYGNGNDTEGTSIPSGYVVSGSSDVTRDLRQIALPYMRAVTVGFRAEKLKPNTKLYAFFDDYHITDYCISGTNSASYEANVAGFAPNNFGNVITDATGTVAGNFVYSGTAMNLKIPTGVKKFVLTDSPTNGTDKTTYAEANFTATGTLVQSSRQVTVDVDTTNGGNNTSGPPEPVVILDTYTRWLMAFTGIGDPNSLTSISSVRSRITTPNGITSTSDYMDLFTYDAANQHLENGVNAITTTYGEIYDENGNRGVIVLDALRGGVDLGAWQSSSPDSFEAAANIYDSLRSALTEKAEAVTNGSASWSKHELDFAKEYTSKVNPNASVQEMIDAYSAGMVIALNSEGVRYDATSGIKEAATALTGP